RGVRQQVQLAVLAQEALEVGLSHGLGEHGETLELALAEVGDRHAQQERLDALTHEVDLGALGEAEPLDPRTRVRDEAYEALGLELAQRVAHGQAARAELRRELFLADPGAGRKLTVQDLLAQASGDARRGGPGVDAYEWLLTRTGPPGATGASSSWGRSRRPCRRGSSR